MKKSFTPVLRAGVAAAALMFAGAAMAASSTNLKADGSYFDSVLSASTFNGDTDVAAGAWSVTFGGSTFWAYCIDPVTTLSDTWNNYSATPYTASAAETRLYDYYYASSVVDPRASSNVTAAAFQIALWELHSDHSTGAASLTSGAQSFAGFENQDEVTLAAQMLATATDSSLALKNTYQFTSLTSTGFKSQELLSVSAVPEASSWAMMAAGLGLIGFMSRRRKSA